MSLATAVIRSTADKNTASLFLQETKIIKALLKQYEARGYLLVDVLDQLPADRLYPLLKGNNRRKEVLIYHHIGPWDAETWQQLHTELPALKLLYVSGPIHRNQVVDCFRSGVKAIVTTGSETYGPAHPVFARKFYANLSAGAKLEDAFEQARIFVEMEQNQAIQKPMSFSRWQAEQAPGQQTVPWGLFYTEEGASSLSMSLPQKGEVRIVSKQEHRYWLMRQRFKDQFLKDWGRSPYQYHLVTVEDGPVGMAQLCEVIREEVCLPYRHAGVRVIKIDFSASLEEAKIKLLAQFQETARKFVDIPPLHAPVTPDIHQADGIAFLIKMFQSEWPFYGAKLLTWMKETIIPAIFPQEKPIDVICICTLITDQAEHVKKAHAPVSIKRIVDSCKIFAASDSVDFRL